VSWAGAGLEREEIREEEKWWSMGVGGTEQAALYLTPAVPPHPITMAQSFMLSLQKAESKQVLYGVGQCSWSKRVPSLLPPYPVWSSELFK